MSDTSNHSSIKVLLLIYSIAQWKSQPCESCKVWYSSRTTCNTLKQLLSKFLTFSYKVARPKLPQTDARRYRVETYKFRGNKLIWRRHIPLKFLFGELKMYSPSVLLASSAFPSAISSLGLVSVGYVGFGISSIFIEVQQYAYESSENKNFRWVCLWPISKLQVGVGELEKKKTKLKYLNLSLQRLKFLTTHSSELIIPTKYIWE